MDWCKQERQSISKFMNTNWENSHISHLLSCLAFLLDSFLHFFFTLSDKRCGGAADLKKENVVLFVEVLTFFSTLAYNAACTLYAAKLNICFFYWYWL